MDRVNLILAALASGAANQREGATDEVASAHGELKAILQQHLGDSSDAKTALERYEESPEAGREQLHEVLGSTKAIEKDFSIVVAAQNLLKLVDPEGSAGGKYSVQARSLPGMKIGH